MREHLFAAARVDDDDDQGFYEHHDDDRDHDDHDDHNYHRFATSLRTPQYRKAQTSGGVSGVWVLGARPTQ